MIWLAIVPNLVAKRQFLLFSDKNFNNYCITNNKKSFNIWTKITFCRSERVESALGSSKIAQSCYELMRDTNAKQIEFHCCDSRFSMNLQ